MKYQEEDLGDSLPRRSREPRAAPSGRGSRKLSLTPQKAGLDAQPGRSVLQAPGDPWRGSSSLTCGQCTLKGQRRVPSPVCPAPGGAQLGALRKLSFPDAQEAYFLNPTQHTEGAGLRSDLEAARSREMGTGLQQPACGTPQRPARDLCSACHLSPVHLPPGRHACPGLPRASPTASQLTICGFLQTA